MGSPRAALPVQNPGAVDPTSLPIPEQPPSPPQPLSSRLVPVSADRLEHPSDGDWLMSRRTYDGWGYSPLDQIDAKNVRDLRPVWTLSTGMNNGHEAAPIVNGGVMFVSTSFDQVLALEAKTGRLLWRYHSPPPGNVRGKPVSRGVALFGDKVFFCLTEAILVAVEAKTGKEVWRASVGANSTGGYMTAPPLVADGKLLVGISGGDGPNRGFVPAHDPATAGEIWKTCAIPAPGSLAATHGAANWKTGGGATWMTGNYGPATERRVSGERGTVIRGSERPARATTSSPHPHSRSTSRPAPSKDISSTRRMSRGTGTKCRRRSRRLPPRRTHIKGLVELRPRRLSVFSRTQRRRDQIRRWPGRT